LIPSLHKLSFKKKQEIARKERAQLKKVATQIKKIQKTPVNKMTKSQASKMNKLIQQYINMKKSARYAK
jgi:hypothetical protein